MKNDNYRAITYARFINLIDEFFELEDLLHYFRNKEVMCIDRNRDALEPIITVLLQESAIHQREIRTHLEECREWDAFPEAFWMASDESQTIGSHTGEYPRCGTLVSKLEFVIEEVNRIKKLVENCLIDYQRSGYIGHQPVAIDFLDCLIGIHDQLHYMCNLLMEIIRSNIQLAIH